MKKLLVPIVKNDIRLAIAKVKVYRITTTDAGPLLAERKAEKLLP